MALGRQVALDGLMQEFAAVVQNGAHDATVEGELDLVETDRRHGQSVNFLPGRENRRGGEREKRPSLSNSDQSSQPYKNRNCCLVIFFYLKKSFTALMQ